MKTPDLIIEQLYSGEIKKDELSPERQAELDTQSEQEFFAKILQSNQDILTRYPECDMEKAVLQKIRNRSSNRPVHKNNYFFVRTLSAAAVLCCLILVSVVTLQMKPASDSTFEVDRSKGNGAKLFIYRKAANIPELLSDRATAQEGDVIQLGYLADGDKYGVIVSVDGNGTLTQHFPDSGNTAAPLEGPGLITLGFSYQLDNAPKFEYFYFLSSPEPFSFEKMKQEISRSASGNTLQESEFESGLSKNIHTTRIMLLK